VPVDMDQVAVECHVVDTAMDKEITSTWTTAQLSGRQIKANSKRLQRRVAELVNTGLQKKVARKKAAGEIRMHLCRE